MLILITPINATPLILAIIMYGGVLCAGALVCGLILWIALITISGRNYPGPRDN